MILGLKGLYEFSPAQIREGLTERSTKVLVSYRKTCSQNTPVGQLVLPESFKLLPLYTNCLVRNDVISGTGKTFLCTTVQYPITHPVFIDEYLTH